MNSFSGVGIISDVKTSGKALKFKFSLQQEKPCDIPCLLFDKTDEAKARLENLAASGQSVWLQGKVFCTESKYRGRTKKEFTVLAYTSSIRRVVLF